jgi:p-hydroxybenzoate 3-monooxygenase
MTIVRERTQVAIVGAGPAGLLLSQLLSLEGIATVTLELRSLEYCLGRVRAGVLEHEVARLIADVGVGARMLREGLVHEGIELRFDGCGHRIPMTDLTGRAVTVYGQQELVKDLVEHRLAAGGDLRFEAEDVVVHDHATDAPRVTFRRGGLEHELGCDIVAGCDGFHGMCRETIPAGLRRAFTIAYPWAWLGILAEAPPATDELIYACHERGFALYSMRSRAVSRLYLQVPADEPIDAWPEERVWDELDARMENGEDPSWRVNRGPTLEKSITPMRSFVSEPMQHGRLFLAGDASHIVPPTGAKGLNLAVHDVWNLSEALISWYRSGSDEGLERYSDACAARVWRAQDFSAYMTRLVHVPDEPYEHRLQLARLRYVAASEAAARSLSENYVGLPRDELPA